jgi:TolA-binding protein
MDRLNTFIMILIILASICLAASENDDLIFAIGLYEDGNYHLAEQEMEKYLAEFPQSKYRTEAIYILADIKLQLKKYPKALELFLELKNQPPTDIAYSELLFRLGQSYYYLADFYKASKIFEELISKYPKFAKLPQIHFLLGCCYHELNEPAKAREYLIRSLAGEEKMITRQKLIEVYLSENDYESAELEMISALNNPENDRYLYYALIMFHNENVKRGEWNNVLDIGYDKIPPESEYYEQYVLLLAIALFETGNYNDAAERLKNTISEKGKYYYALSLMKLDREQEAKDILLSLQDAENSEIIANSLFYLAELNDDPNEREQILNSFINRYPENVFIPEALYLVGYAQFDQKKYLDAAQSIKTARQMALPETYLERAMYLEAEALYLGEKTDAALIAFSDYLVTFPNGEFAPDAYFKKGLCLYKAGKHSEARKEFRLVIYNFPEHDKTGMSNFYLGEISLLEKDFSEARDLYSRALERKTDKNLIWLRIAQSWFHSKNYGKATAALINVDDSSEKYIDKLVLMGDISFSEKNYDKALKNYLEAARLENDNNKKEILMAKTAWTYYQKGDYNNASVIYNQLSIHTDNPSTYTLQSATALFSARQYDTALQQYQIFIQNFPDSPHAINVKVGIGDCYYNLGNFEAARKQYRYLIPMINEPVLLQSVLDGWKWSTEQSGKDFLSEIEDFVNESIPLNSRFLVEDYKAKYMFNKQMYHEVNDMADRMIKQYPYPMKDLEYLKARSLKNLQHWKEADDYYARLFMEYKDPLLQYEWADISLAMGRIDTSIKKLQYAAEKDNNPEYILKLFEVEVKNNSTEFPADYERFRGILDGDDKERAELINCRWLLNQNKIAEAQALIEKLKLSRIEEIKAEAQYLSGYSLFQQQMYQEAVPELLRVRHLFPYLVDIRHRSEQLAFRAYIKMKKMQEAENLLNNIRNDLTPELAREFDNLLKGE